MTAALVPQAEVLRERLSALLRELSLDADSRQLGGLLDHLRLIQRWNAVYNLTAVRDADDMVAHHLADCLAVIPSLRRQLKTMAAACGVGAVGSVASPTLLDAGSGAGLPGLVIARMCPDLSVTCVDTVGKKAAFLTQVIVETGLVNARAVHGRVEDVAVASQDVVVARAYASLHDLVRTTAAALRPDGCWMAMKARKPDAEIDALDPAQIDVFHVEQIHVPGLHAARCLVWMRKR